MTREEWLVLAQDFLHAHGVERFKAYEVADAGRVHVRTGTILQAPPVHLLSYALLLLEVLAWLRAEDGEAPVSVNSWYRDPAYNRAVGGAANSMHVTCGAADINKRGWSPKRTALALLRHPQANQLGLGLYPTFVHADVRGRIGRPAPARWGPAGAWWR